MATVKNFSQGGRHEAMSQALTEVFANASGKPGLKDGKGGDTPAKRGRDANRMLRKK